MSVDASAGSAPSGPTAAEGACAAQPAGRPAARPAREAVFTEIWRCNSWGDPETRSGPGSRVARTAEFRQALEAFLQLVRPRVLLDAPCGDYNWMRHVRLPAGTRYVGIDIVEPMISKLQAEHGSECVAFLHGDITEAAPPPGTDVWLCRESLFHLSFHDAAKVLESWRRSRTPWFLATSTPTVPVNEDIETGGWRRLNLQLSPFNLGEPLLRLPDGSPADPDKIVGVWRLT